MERLASLQRGIRDQITTSAQLYDWATVHVDVKCFYVTSDVVRKNEKVIENRMLSALPDQGKRKFHAFVPINLFQVKASCLSGDQAEFIIFHVLPKPREIFYSSSCNVDNLPHIHPENKKWYISKLVDIDEIDKEKKFISM